MSPTVSTQSDYYCLSYYMQNSIINHLLRNTPIASGSNNYVGLFNGNPGSSGSNATEVSAGDYNRVLTYITGSVLPFTVNNGSAVNNQQITFTTPASNWGTISHFGIFNGAGASASMLFYGPLATGSGYISSGDDMKIIPGNIQLKIYGDISPCAAGNMLNHVLNNSSYTTPGSGVYIALYGHLAPLLVYPSNVYYEVSGSIGYSRVPVGGTSYWSVPTTGSSSNSASVVFSPGATEDWGIIGKIIITTSASYSQSTSRIPEWSSETNYLFRGVIFYERTVPKGGTYKIPAEKIVIRLDR